jgi:hypothetical protein
MALKAASVRKSALFPALALFCATVACAQSAPQKPTPEQGAFDTETASRMLLQLSEALQGHSQKQFLALFDLDRMKDGALFKQQITSFFSQTDSIRAHLKLDDTAMEGDKATMTVEAEMEAEPSNGGPIARRTDLLTFVAAKPRGIWKFVDIQPRWFFSLP